MCLQQQCFRFAQINYHCSENSYNRIGILNCDLHSCTCQSSSEGVEHRPVYHMYMYVAQIILDESRGETWEKQTRPMWTQCDEVNKHTIIVWFRATRFRLEFVGNPFDSIRFDSFRLDMVRLEWNVEVRLAFYPSSMFVVHVTPCQSFTVDSNTHTLFSGCNYKRNRNWRLVHVVADWMGQISCWLCLLNNLASSFALAGLFAIDTRCRDDDDN